MGYNSDTKFKGLFIPVVGGGGGGIIEFYMTIRNIFKSNDEARFFHTTSSLQPKQRSTQDLFVSWVRNVVR